MIFLLCLLLAILVPVPSPWSILLVVAGGLLEIAEVAVLRHWSQRLALRLPATTGAEAMLGDTGEVVSPCTPAGTVRIRGELWDARCAEGAPAGSTVEIVGVDDLELLVSPAAARRPRHRLRLGRRPTATP